MMWSNQQTHQEGVGMGRFLSLVLPTFVNRSVYEPQLDSFLHLAREQEVTWALSAFFEKFINGKISTVPHCGFLKHLV